MNLVKGTLRADRDVVTFAEAGEGTIALELPFLQEEKDSPGRQVVLGFRPESIAIAPAPTGSNRPAASFRAVVERSEPNGAQTDLYLRTGAHELICRTAHWESKGGRRLQFTIDPVRTHVFAEETGLRLATGYCP